jgi:hypothetical protein
MAYVNLRINYDLKVMERLSIPPEHLVRLFQTDLQIHHDRIAKLEALVATLIKTNTKQPTLLIKTEDGTVETAEQRYIAAVTQLISQGVNPSALHIKKMGIGSSTISRFRKKYPDNKFPVVEKKVVAAVQLEQKDAEEEEKSELGYKVVVPEQPEAVHRSKFPKGSVGSKEHKAATKTANAARTKRNRDVKTYGLANVTTQDECAAKGHTIKKRQKLGKGVIRDICV